MRSALCGLLAYPVERAAYSGGPAHRRSTSAAISLSDMTQSLIPDAQDVGSPANAGAPAVDAQPRPKRSLRIVLEVGLIAAGVFLGLAGDQWREKMAHREQAKATLQRFRVEMAANRAAVVAVREYRLTTLAGLRAYLDKPHSVRNTADVRLQGLRIIHFEQSAWDLALATQSLSYIEPNLAADVSRVYNRQARIGELSRGIIQAMYVLPSRDNFDGLAAAAETYYADLAEWEPELVGMYDSVLPRIDRALGARARTPAAAAKP